MQVEVLMATHNGEKFIHKMLDSLASQVGVQIDLVVSDDNSMDKTIEIVHSFRNSFNSLNIMNGPDLGPKHNFAKLIQNSRGKFSAFADQDDIWLPDHLKLSIDRLILHDSVPALVFSKVTEFSNSGTSSEWPTLDQSPQLSTWLTENFARGCTIVMNRELIDLIRKSDFNQIYMHDWWSVLVAKTCGILEFLPYPTIEYRIHDGNVVGAKKSLIRRSRLFLRTYFSNGGWVPQRQAAQLLAEFSFMMTLDNSKLVNKFVNIADHSFIQRYIFLYQSKFNFRQSNFENILLKFMLLLFPRKVNN